jgi:hypothetical protein
VCCGPVNSNDDKGFPINRIDELLPWTAAAQLCASAQDLPLAA